MINLESYHNYVVFKTDKNGRKKMDILDYDKKKHGSLYRCISPFREYRKSFNISKGSLISFLGDTDEKYLEQYKDFIQRLNNSEILTIKNWQKNKNMEMKYKLPDNAKKLGHKFPIIFMCLEIKSKKWQEVEENINKLNKERKLLRQKLNALSRLRLERENMELKDALKEINKKIK